MQLKRKTTYTDSSTTVITQYAKNLTTALDEEINYSSGRNDVVAKIELESVERNF